MTVYKNVISPAEHLNKKASLLNLPGELFVLKNMITS
jgi:hypothetical protein